MKLGERRDLVRPALLRWIELLQVAEKIIKKILIIPGPSGPVLTPLPSLLVLVVVAVVLHGVRASPKESGHGRPDRA